MIQNTVSGVLRQAQRIVIKVGSSLVTNEGRGLDEVAIVAALKSRIAGFKVPRCVFVANELPRNAMGKVQKNLLRERYGASPFQSMYADST